MKEEVRGKLLKRDGDECWFCGKALGEDCTIEHLVPRAAGGTNALVNLALAHRLCNQQADDWPLARKLELRATLRAEGRRGASLAASGGQRSDHQ